MEIEKKRFQTMFPNLSREMEQEPQGVGISSVRSDVPTGEKASAKTFAGYVPDVIDFIRRCDNEQQAVEIIDYLEKRQEINSAYAKKLKKQLNVKGVRSFGSKKQADYYSREGIV
jgi:hypothetical protein